MIPPEIHWDPDATPPQYTDNADQVIETGTNLRIKLIGLRSDVGAMYAIGSIKEDFLGYVISLLAIQGNYRLTWVIGRFKPYFDDRTTHRSYLLRIPPRTNPSHVRRGD